MELIKKIKSGTDWIWDYCLYLFLGYLLYQMVSNETFDLSMELLWTQFSEISIQGMIALGMATILLVGGMDLSVGAVIALSSAVGASFMQDVAYGSRMYLQVQEQLPILVPFLLCIGTSVFFCVGNAILMTKFKIQAIIGSFTMQIFLAALVGVYFNSQNNQMQPLTNFDPEYIEWIQRTLGNGTAYTTVIFLVIIILMWFFWNKMVLGRNIYAVGGNQKAATYAGISVHHTVVSAYIVAGILYGIAGFMEVGITEIATADMNINLAFDALLACVIGGVSLAGGVGSVFGVVLGVLFLSVLSSYLEITGMTPETQVLLKGFLLLLAVATDARRNAKNESK